MDVFTLKHQNIWMHVNNINTINNMSNHTHDITILALLSTHAPLIYKHDPTPNPSLPINQILSIMLPKKMTIVN